jgi:hypothetical protein
MWSNTDGAIALAVVSTILLGAAVGRWWLLLVPVPPALLLIAGATEDYEWSRGDWILFIALTALAIEALFGVGLVLNRGMRSLARPTHHDGAAQS